MNCQGLAIGAWFEKWVSRERFLIGVFRFEGGWVEKICWTSSEWSLICKRRGMVAGESMALRTQFA